MNITEFLEEYQIKYWETGSHHHVCKGWIGVDCPQCSPNSNKVRLGINLAGKYASCWVCGYISLPNILMEMTKQSYKTIKEKLGEINYQTKQRKLANKKLQLPHGLGELLPVHKKYLKNRGLDPEKLKKDWGIEGIGLTNRLSWRIFIPIHQYHQTVSWTTRSLSDEGLRYISAKPEEEIISAHSLLFGEDHVRHSIVVTEGPLDAMKIGFGAAAVFLLCYSKSQILKISKYPSITIIFDSEKEAQKKARKLCEELECFPGETTRVVIDAKDPGSAKEKEIKLIRRSFIK